MLQPRCSHNLLSSFPATHWPPHQMHRKGRAIPNPSCSRTVAKCVASQAPQRSSAPSEHWPISSLLGHHFTGYQQDKCLFIFWINMLQALLPSASPWDDSTKQNKGEWEETELSRGVLTMQRGSPGSPCGDKNLPLRQWEMFLCSEHPLTWMLLWSPEQRAGPASCLVITMGTLLGHYS